MMVLYSLFRGYINKRKFVNLLKRFHLLGKVQQGRQALKDGEPLQIRFTDS
jgi:hypothetical protein